MYLEYSGVKAKHENWTTGCDHSSLFHCLPCAGDRCHISVAKKEDHAALREIRGHHFNNYLKIGQTPICLHEDVRGHSAWLHSPRSHFAMIGKGGRGGEWRKEERDSEWEAARNRGQIFLPDTNGSGRGWRHRSSVGRWFLSLALGACHRAPACDKGERRAVSRPCLSGWGHTSSANWGRKQGVIWKVSEINTPLPSEASGKD